MALFCTKFPTLTLLAARYHVTPAAGGGTQTANCTSPERSSPNSLPPPRQFRTTWRVKIWFFPMILWRHSSSRSKYSTSRIFSFAFSIIIINFTKVSVIVIMICCDMRTNFLDFDATYHIDIKGHNIIVTNNLIPMTSPEQSTGVGLENLKES